MLKNTRIARKPLPCFFCTMLLCLSLLTSAQGNPQALLTLHAKKISIAEVFTAIWKQTGLKVMYAQDLLNDQEKVSVSFNKAPVNQVLNTVLKEKAIGWTFADEVIVLRPRQDQPTKENTVADTLRRANVSGTVTDMNGNPLPGVSLVAASSNSGTATDDAGIFLLRDIPLNSLLTVSRIGYQKQTVLIDGNREMNIRLIEAPSNLDEVVIMAYGNTTKRLNTGNIAKLTAKEITQQPVSNVLAALSGRIPGVLITQESGVAGSGIKIQIRGQNSLLQGSDPLFIVDGVPLSYGNMPINQLNTAAGVSTEGKGTSPFSLINPSDIASIEILKDADATAIYGSRGANGVVLITTRKGAAGKTRFSFSSQFGVSKATKTMDTVPGSEYLALRREAFKNDGIIPTAANAPDLMVWDTTKPTDFKKLLTGNSAKYNDVQMSLSGGSNTTKFLISGTYHAESTLFPSSLTNNRAAFNFNLNHRSANQRFGLTLNNIYGNITNRLPIADLSYRITTFPFLKLYDDAGKLNWADKGQSYYEATRIADINPMSLTMRHYRGEYQNLNTSLQLYYLLTKQLSLRTSFGYNYTFSDENSQTPLSSIDPYTSLQASSQFGNRKNTSWIIEPQAEYQNKTGPGTLKLLIGTTLQDNTSKGSIAAGQNYSSDMLLGSIAAAGKVTNTNTYSKYRYEGVYGRINYNIKEKYILNLSGRRDGSSRFGPQNRFANFGALGAAWLFGNEQAVKRLFPALSFGKLRGSYGLTGNDQIGDYKYLDTWVPSANAYQGTSTLSPASLYNPFYSWEKNQKFEMGLEAGFFKDRLVVAVSYFRNNSNNQLVNYTLPGQTGFTSILKNLNAKIRNTGWEIQATHLNLAVQHFQWTSTVNLTIPKNRLIDFPGLQSSSYAHLYVIGRSLTTKYLYHYLGVDPATGIYQFEDADHNGTIDFAQDRVTAKGRDVKYYGALGNTFSWKNIELGVFAEFRKQQGFNYLVSASTLPFATIATYPVTIYSRWQKPGDIANFQKLTTQTGGAVAMAAANLIGSDGVISDASFIRIKTLSFSYRVPSAFSSLIGVSQGRAFVQAQNLFTITNYNGADPESQDFQTLPPLRTITAGIQLTF